MKAILEFDLPDDRAAHMMAVDAADLFGVIWDINNIIRNHYKHDVPADTTIGLIKETLIELDTDRYN